MTTETIKHIHVFLTDEELNALKKTSTLLTDLTNLMTKNESNQVSIDMMYGEFDYISLDELFEVSNIIDKLKNIDEII